MDSRAAKCPHAKESAAVEVARHKWTLAGLLSQRAQEAPDRPFVDVVGEAGDTFGQVHAAARRWAGLVRGLGVAPGEYVATMLAQPRMSLHGWFGINAARAGEVPVHLDYRGTYLAHVLNTTGVRVAIVDDGYVERFAEIADEVPLLETLVVAGDADAARRLPWRVVALEPALAVADPVDESATLGQSDISCVLFTSGTTGASKAVLIPYGHIRASVDGAWPPGDLGPGDAYYSMLPLYHVAAKVAVGAMLQAGGRVVLKPRFRTDEFWAEVRATGSTCVCLMGSMTGFLLDQPPRSDDRDHPLEKALIIPLPHQLDAFRERFGVRVRTLYNQTETSAPLRSSDYDTPDYRACGRPRPGVTCRLVDENDEEVAPGEVGELIVRCDEPWTMMAGYLGMAEKTVEAWRNQWMHTGDAFRMDAAGNYYFLDRMKDAIRRRGENISSVELEASVCEHHAVLECAAVGVESEYEEEEEEVKVIVVPQSGVELAPADLVEFLTERVPRFMVPRYVEVVPELPRTPTAKIRKVELRKLGITERTWDREALRPARGR
ncbi:MAG: AMP-binding protein [Streptosporangiales bacterium]|nr:AMP-binding protein [Streptosporangiales bacterium]